MTFDEFTSNKEQVEAHFVAYTKVWNDGCPEALVENFPAIELEDLFRLKAIGFDYYLTDVHLEIQMRDAPTAMLSDWRKDFPDELPTPASIVRCLVRAYATFQHDAGMIHPDTPESE